MKDPLSLVSKSLNDFKNNFLSILLPFILSIGVIFVLLIFVLIQFFISQSIFGEFIIINGVSPGLIAFWIFFGVIDVVLLIILAYYLVAAQYGVITDIAVTGKTSAARMFTYAKEYWGKVLTYSLAQSIIVYVPLAIIAALAYAVYLTSPAGGSILAVLFGLAYIIFLIGLAVMTVFAGPILMSHNVGGFAVISKAVNYSKTHLSQTFITVAIVMVIGILSYILSLVIRIPYYVIDFMKESGSEISTVLWVVYFISLVLSTIVSWVTGLVSTLFVFNSYFSENPVPSVKKQPESRVAVPKKQVKKRI